MEEIISYGEQIRARLRADLREAVALRDRAEIQTLRTLIAAIENAEAVDVNKLPNGGQDLVGDHPRRHLSRAEVQALLEAEVRARREAIAVYEEHARQDVVEGLQRELMVLARYL